MALALHREILIKKEITMLYWAFMFLVIAIIAGIFGLTGVAAVASEVAWILFVLGLILAVVFFIMGRRPPKL
ncbi:MAG: DUF1328 domain-containing protein [Porticoccus sp.]|nr:DUF1328 domain-containing protein [Porticoccus sp.]